MKQSLALALAIVLTTSAVSAGEVRVSIAAEVDVNLNHPSSPYGSIGKGSGVSIEFRVTTPGTVVMPGQITEYDIVQSTFRLRYVGLAPIVLAGPAKVQVRNDTHGDLVLGFNSPNPGFIFPDGTQMWGGVGASSSTPGITDVEQLAGQYSAVSGFITHGVLFIEPLSYGIDPPLVGSLFCDPMDPNSTGESTALTATFSNGPGSPVHLEPRMGPPGEFGYFLVGTASQDPGAPISQGRLCLSTAPGETIGRFNVGGGPLNSLGQFDNFGRFTNLSGTSSGTYGFDVPATLPMAGNPALMAGQTWHYQLWHRDQMGGAGASNFSNGVTVDY